MPDISIVIPHRGSPLGLWLTVTSAENHLKGFSREYIIVCNGQESLTPEDRELVRQLKHAGHKADLILEKSPMSPPAARQLGSNLSTSDLLCFFDNHCMVSGDYFKRAVADFNHYGMDMLHSSTKFYSSGEVAYHYKTKLAYNFWAESSFLPKHELKPYKAACAGHGGFFVTRSSWEAVGGYGPSDLFTGYGGEEIYTDFKYWLRGKSVWIDPQIIHYHYAGDRGYSRQFTDAFYMNLLICANVVGGKSWLYKVYDSFSTPGRFLKDSKGKPFFQILEEAELHSDRFAKEFQSQASMSLDNLLTWFTANDIPW